MVRRRLTPLLPPVSLIGFGAFKIGRNQKIKYPAGYALPDAASAVRLVRGLLDLGINYIDTAPAYGSSEERLGRALAGWRGEVVVSTKVGESFEQGESRYDFSATATKESVARSLRRLGREVLDLVFVHSDGRDEEILTGTEVVPTLLKLRERGLIRAVGFSGKTVGGARRAMAWADVLMVPYHLRDREHESVIREAAERGIGVVVKKGLAAGWLAPEEAIPFLASNPGVGSIVVGSLNLEHMRANMALAEDAAAKKPGDTDHDG